MKLGIGKFQYLAFLSLCVCLGTATVVARYVQSNLMIGIFVFALAGLMTFLLQSLFKSSLNTLKSIIQSVNKNDLMIDIQEEHQSFTEDIVLEIKKMLDVLKENFRQQVQMSSQISTVSNQLNTISSECTDSMGSVVATTEETCSNNEKQFHMLERIAENIETVVNILKDINEEMNATAKFTAESIGSAKQGINSTGEIRTKMKEIKELVSYNAQEIQTLKKRSEEVVDLIALINAIASQTTMLALNASIEAARAGEHGKGFAVVATEVSKLSQETTGVSNKIQDVIMTLQKEIVSIAKMLENEMRHVEEGYLVIDKTIGGLYSIDDTLSGCVEQVEKVQKQILKLNQSGQEIVVGIDNVTNFSKEIFSQMQFTAAQTSIQNERIATLKEIAGRLGEDADHMQQYVTSKVMEGKMRKAVSYIQQQTNKQTIHDRMLEALRTETGMDVIYITNSNGEVRYCNEKGAIGLNLYKIDPSYEAMRRGRSECVTTPVKNRVEDGRLFKFFAMIDNMGIIYQVGLSIDTLLKF